MNYEQMFKDKRSSGELRELTPTFIKWKGQKGPIVGCFQGRSSLKFRQSGNEGFAYVFETDSGPVKFLLGSQIDKETGDRMTPGCIYAIEFKGQTDIGGGQRVNNFSILFLGIDEDYKAGGSDNVPF